MRPLVPILVALAVGLAVARLSTGIVYGSDSPVAYLVVKSSPGLRIERPERDGPPIGALTVLDREEPDLFYRTVYVAAMRAAPALALAALLAALMLPRTARRRA